MQNKLKTSIIFIVLAFALVAGAYTLSNLQKEFTSANDSTEALPYEGVTINRELSFDDPDDLIWLDLLPIAESQQNLFPDEKYLQNGSLVFSAENGLREVNTKFALPNEMFYHIRLKVPNNGPCFSAQVFYFTMANNSEKSLRISGCNENTLTLNAIINNPDGSQIAPIQINGNVMVNADQWIDLIFGVNPEGDKIFCFAGDPEEASQFLYNVITLPEEWQSKAWGFSFGGFFDAAADTTTQVVEIDFLRLGRGDISSYLLHHLPGYIDKHEEIDRLLFEDSLSIHDLSFSEN